MVKVPLVLWVVSDDAMIGHRAFVTWRGKICTVQEYKNMGARAKKRTDDVDALPPPEACVFFFEIVSSHTFRQLIEFLKRISREIPLVVSREGIAAAVWSATSRQLFANVTLRREDMLRFFVREEAVNLPAEDGDPEWFHVVKVDASELIDQLRAVAKRNSVCIYQPLEAPDRLYIRATPDDAKEVQEAGESNPLEEANEDDEAPVPRGGWARIRAHAPVAFRNEDLPPRATACPNATARLARFCAGVSRMQKARAERMSLRIYERGATISGTSGDGALSIAFNDPPESDTEPIASITLAGNTVPALAKIANFAPEGVVKIYAIGAAGARIDVPVGCYGSARLYIYEIAKARGRKAQ